MSSSDDEHRSGLTDAAGRAALYPARAAARVWRGQLEDVADEMLSAPEIARVIDRALAGPLPEEIARRSFATPSSSGSWPSSPGAASSSG